LVNEQFYSVLRFSARFQTMRVSSQPFYQQWISIFVARRRVSQTLLRYVIAVHV